MVVLLLLMDTVLVTVVLVAAEAAAAEKNMICGKDDLVCALSMIKLPLHCIALRRNL